MKKYWNYLKYVLEHKKNVFLECWSDGLYIHAFTHDMSKFSPCEFFSYANYFYGEHGKLFNGGFVWEFKEHEKAENEFNYGWLHHQRKNKHHWDYWVDSKGNALQMPNKYIKQMICDWKAMSRKFGDTATDFYLNSKHKMILHSKTIEILESMLKS